jgi:hypothetical protein
MANSKKSTKSPTRRSRYKYSALEKTTNLKTRQDEIDDVKTYFEQLPEGQQEVTLADGTKKVMDVKEWMNRFMEEEVHADFRHDGAILNKAKKDKKRIYNKNNARNRCVYTKEKAKGSLDYVEKLEDFEPFLQENADQDEDDRYYEPKMKL